MRYIFKLSKSRGLTPQLYFTSGNPNDIKYVNTLFPITGSIYNEFPERFEPFCKNAPDNGTAGKAMAYIALGKYSNELISEWEKMYLELLSGFKQKLKLEENDIYEFSDINPFHFTQTLINVFSSYANEQGFIEPDIIANFHNFLERLLIKRLSESIIRWPMESKNLCFVGGSALNIKWNSKIRENNIVENVWIPPFTNDSGSAIGVACCSMVSEDKIYSLKWNVYSGPAILNSNSNIKELWFKYSCSLKKLANIISEFDEPILFLNDRAELGPRALGNRSILAQASSPNMKHRLNKVKHREDYRPVAPICMEEYAPEIFEPGTPDPYMLFDHQVCKNWEEKIPAIMHLDGSARLQTVNKNENSLIYELLYHYHKLTRIPLLCNTSANYKGKGFFPDITDAMIWGKCNFIWNNYTLYINSESQNYHEYLRILNENISIIE